jgi:predicted ATPase
MRIDELWIADYKNLQDFTIDLEENELISVVVGRNGTGKSNLIEAIVIIFRDLDLRERNIPFAYRIRYQIAGKTIEIDADPARDTRTRFVITATDLSTHEQENLSFVQLTEPEALGLYRPRFLFAYYSGHNPRVEALFVKHKRNFYVDAREGVEKPLRPFFYAEMIHGQFALLTFFIKQSEDDTKIREFMRKHLSITDLHSVLFVMREPDWKSPAGNHLFWNARGTVEGILARLYDIALAPIRLNQQIPLQFRKKATKEHLYLYLPDVESLQQLADNYSNQQEFFKALESMYLSDLISEVRIRFKLREIEQPLVFNDLSEGEQQLLMVLGLMRFTKEDEALFLLDEPDTHLNPAWSRLYLDFIADIVGEQKNSQVIILTHNPLTLSALTKEQVMIMVRDEESEVVTSDSAEEDPRGMGIEGILTSDIFGLRTTLDRPTLKLLDEKRVLSAQESELSINEKTRLAEINDKLDEMRFNKTSPDPMFEPFAEAMAVEEQDAGLQVPVLSKKQQEDRKKLAIEVLRRVKKARGSE